MDTQKCILSTNRKVFMKNKIKTIINNASKLGVTVKFKEENVINQVWSDNIIGSIEYKDFKAIIYICDVRKLENINIDNTWIMLKLYDPSGEEVPSNSDIVLDYCNFLKPFEHYEDFAEFIDEYIEIQG